MDYLQLSPFTTANSHWWLRIIDGFTAQCPWLTAQQLMLCLTVILSHLWSRCGDPPKSSKLKWREYCQFPEYWRSSRFYFCTVRGWTNWMVWKIKIQESLIMKQMARRSCICKPSPIGVKSCWNKVGSSEFDAVLVSYHPRRLWRTPGHITESRLLLLAAKQANKSRWGAGASKSDFIQKGSRQRRQVDWRYKEPSCLSLGVYFYRTKRGSWGG